MDVIQKIHNLYPEMTRKQKSIADILLESPEDIAYITLANLSQKTSSSELTLLRFCQKLGYSNFLEMKAAFREYTQSSAFYYLCCRSDPRRKTHLYLCS